MYGQQDLLVWYVNCFQYKGITFGTSSLICLSINVSNVFRKNDDRLIGLKDLAWAYDSRPDFGINTTFTFRQLNGTYPVGKLALSSVHSVPVIT